MQKYQVNDTLSFCVFNTTTDLCVSMFCINTYMLNSRPSSNSHKCKGPKIPPTYSIFFPSTAPRRLLSLPRGGFLYSAGIPTNRITFPTTWADHQQGMESFNTAWGDFQQSMESFNTVWGEFQQGVESFNTVWGEFQQGVESLNTVWGDFQQGVESSNTVWGEFHNAKNSSTTQRKAFETRYNSYPLLPCATSAYNNSQYVKLNFLEL